MEVYYDDYFDKLQEAMLKEAEERAEKRAEKREKEANVLQVIKFGKMTLEEIAECFGLTLKRVQTLAKKL